MRITSILILLVAQHAAHAGPVEGAIHAGAAASQSPIPDDDTRSQTGAGWVLDGDAGVQLRREVSIHVTAAYASLAEHGEWFDLGDNVEHVRDRYFDGVLRVRFHRDGAFAGVGLGYEVIHETGRVMCVAACEVSFGASPVAETDEGALFELHAGYTFPPVHGIAPQALFSAQRAFVNEGITSARFALGVQF